MKFPRVSVLEGARGKPLSGGNYRCSCVRQRCALLQCCVPEAWPRARQPRDRRPPKAYKGAKVSLYAKGLNNPTSFAWGKGAMFAGDSGNSERPPTVGST